MGISKNSLFLQDQVHLGESKMKNITFWVMMNIFMYFIHGYAFYTTLQRVKKAVFMARVASWSSLSAEWFNYVL